ncbi:MAG: glycosyl hydrolase, partial [Bacteroidota bacterium]
MNKYLVCLTAIILLASPDVFAQNTDLKKLFKDPPAQYKPMPFWHMNGKLTNEGIDSQMRDVKYKSNFGGITVLPVSAQPGFGNGKVFPGMDPAYLSDGYFQFYERILNNAQKLGLKIVWYDDLDFPSGSAGGRMKKLYPADTRKVLSKKDTVVNGTASLTMIVPSGTLMAAVAMNTATKERVDVSKSVSGGQLTWNVPAGEWRVMLFTCDVVNSNMANDIAVDYLDPQAINKYVELNNEQFAKRYKKYFGNTINQIFFDDVGFFTLQAHGERTWTNKFNEKFKAIYGKDPALYYPALWTDIGPETSAARVALFNTRAVLLSEGFPKVITEWCDKYGLKSSGHPPGNYEIQPVDMN